MKPPPSLVNVFVDTVAGMEKNASITAMTGARSMELIGQIHALLDAGRAAEALTILGLRLEEHPRDTAALHGRAAILGLAGDEAAARELTWTALSLEPIVALSGVEGPRVVLADCARGYLSQLGERSITLAPPQPRPFTDSAARLPRLRVVAAFVDCLPPGRPLDDVDLIVCGLGEAEDRLSLGLIQDFVELHPRAAVINPPARVARLRRDGVAATLLGLPGLVVPRVIRTPWRTAADMRDLARGHELTYPLLLEAATPSRQAAMVRIAGEDQWDDRPWPTTTGADLFLRELGEGTFPAWRALSIGGQLFVRPEGGGADFAGDPAAMIGTTAADGLRAMFSRAGLDVAGAEITLLDDGRVLLGSLQPAPPRDDLCHPRIVAALHTLFNAKLSGRSPS